MKKTLFLSAILATALCSSAFGTEYTVAADDPSVTLFNAAHTDGLTIGSGDALKLNLGANYAHNTHSLDPSTAADMTVNLTFAGGAWALNDSHWYLSGDTTINSNTEITGNNAKVLTIANLHGSADLTSTKGDGDGASKRVLQLTGENDYSGTIILQNNNSGSTGSQYLVVSNSQALSHASVNLKSSTRGNILSLNVASANLQRLDGGSNSSIGLTSKTGMAGCSSVAASTLTVNSSTAGTFSGTIDAGVTLAIAAGASQTLSNAAFAEAIVNNGSLAISGASDITGMTEYSSELTYGDTKESSSVSGNGYVYGTRSYQICSGTGNTTVANGATFTHGDFSGSDYANGIVTVSKDTAGGTYFVNNGTLDYSSGSAVASAATTGIVVSNAATITLGTGTQLNHSKVTYNAATTVTGSGNYVVNGKSGMSNAASILGSNVTLSGDNLMLTIVGGTFSNMNLDDAKFGNATLELKGITGGYLNGWNQGDGTPMTKNIKLTNNGNDAAWSWTEGSSSDSTLQTFTGTWSGSGNFLKNCERMQGFKWTGDLSAWTGQLRIISGKDTALTFSGDANTIKVSEIRNDRAGVLSITFAADEDMTMTNSINKGGAGDINISAEQNIAFGGNVTANTVTVSAGKTVNFGSGTDSITTLTLGDGATAIISKAAQKAGTINGTGTLKYTGTTLWEYNRSGMAGTVTLEGVITDNRSNVKYNTNYSANAGTLKNVQIHNLDAGSPDGSITMDGVYGNIRNGGTQQHVTLTGNGLILTEGYTDGQYTFKQLDGDGNLEKRFGVNETFTFKNAAEWTGEFLNTAGTANVTFEGSSKANVIAKDTLNLTLQGTDYSQMAIRAYDGKTATVTVSNSTSDVTIYQMIQDPNDKTSDGVMDVVINTAGHKASITEWATVNSVTLKGNSSVQFNNHNITELTVEAGNSNVSSGAGIGSDEQHKLTSLVLNEGAHLTFDAADTSVPTITMGEGSSITLGTQDSHDAALTITGLTVNGDAAINADLVVSGSGAEITFAKGAVLTMGCTVSIEGADVYVTIDGTIDDMLADVRNGNYLLLIDGLEEGDADAQALTLNTVHINGVTDPELHLAFVKNTYSENGTYAIVVAPEPATATLSLLALAGLMARRRRH